MKKSELATKTLKELKAFALKMGIKKPSVSRKSDLITEILAADKIKKGRSKKTAPKSSSDKDLIIQKKAATHRTFPGVKFASKTPSVSDKSTEPLKEKCPECNNDLVLYTTATGKKMIKCSTSGWDREKKMATGCTYVKWLKPGEMVGGEPAEE